MLGVKGSENGITNCSIISNLTFMISDIQNHSNL